MDQDVKQAPAKHMRGVLESDVSAERATRPSGKRVGAKKKAEAIESLLDREPDSIEHVAAAVGVQPSKVEAWLEAYREGGRDALRSEHVANDDEISAVLADLIEVVRRQLMEDLAKDI